MLSSLHGDVDSNAPHDVDSNAHDVRGHVRGVRDARDARDARDDDSF
ncbi:hypothetical protein GMMP15_1170008 [Candidatus Magnetomoraceae bacterium gMMP-15]